MRRLDGRALAATLCLVTGVTAVSLLACNDRAPDPAGPLRPAASRSREVTAPSPDPDGEAARRRFHTLNRHDWVGVAHNRAIDAYRARLRRGEISHDQCNDLPAFLDAAQRVSLEQPPSAAERAQMRRFARRALEARYCVGRTLGAGGAPPLRLAQATDASPETHVLLDQVASAAALATTSGELATALVPIVEASVQLPGDEPIIVQAAASVAQSSAEYWEANLEATRQDYDAAYGACIGQYASAEEAASACLGLSSGGPAPIVNFGTRRESVRLVGAARFDCRRVNRKEIIGDDVKGGIAGAVGGFVGALATGPAAPVTMPSAVLYGALGGAAGGSLAAIGWQWAQETWCVVRGGGGGPTPVNPT